MTDLTRKQIEQMWSEFCDAGRPNGHSGDIELFASAALDKLIAEAVAAERDRVTRIVASLFPGGYDNNRIKIEDRLSEIAAKGAQT